jgi:enoyl-CoA hydratase
VIEIAHRGPIAVMTLAHGKANTLDSELCEAIVARFDELSPSTTQGVVLTGTGNIFSAGVDLKRAVGGGAAYLRDFLPRLCKAFETVFFYPKPVAAAVNGHAVAGGCVLACAADRRLMASGGGTIGVTELLVGVPFPVIAFEIMRHVVAPQYFEEALFTGATYAPEAARERGFVHELVAREELLDRAVAATQTLAALSPAAFALTKMQSRMAARDTLQRAGDSIDAAACEIWLNPDTLARMRDYVARTLK